MKYGRYLKEHAQDEWRRRYIDYRILKKAIGKAQAELEAGAQPRSIPRMDVTVEEDERDLEAGVLPRARPEASAFSLNVNTSGLSLDSDAASIATQNSRVPFFRRDSYASDATRLTGGKPSSQPRKPFLSVSNEVNPKRWREGYSPSLSLHDLLEILPPECRQFFVLLDRQLAMVSTFYQEREDDAVKRFLEISTQWRELAQHKSEFKAFKERERSTPASGLLAPIVSRVPSAFMHSTSNVVRRTGASRPQLDEPTPTPAPSEVPSAFRHGRPEEYASAKSKLKLATYEFYRWLGILKSYKVLNSTGFEKLKKFDKNTRIPASKAYTAAKLQDVNFRASTRLDELIRETEDAFTSVFEHGDRKRALERLRQLGSTKTHHFAAWRSGLFIGAGIPLLLEGLAKSFHPWTRAEMPYWPALLQVFGALFLPILFSLLFFLNLLSWHYSRINYVLVFQFDIRTRLDMRQFLDIPAFLFFVFSLFFWAAFSNFWPSSIAPTAYPLAFVVFALGFLLFPYPIWHASARWWSICSWCRVFMGGLIRVEFRDFFLGDELNSLYFSVFNLGFMVCTYRHGWPDDAMTVCSTNSTWVTFFLAIVPASLRLGQSIRRYFDSDGLVIHLLNAGKYGAALVYFFNYYNWRIHGSGYNWRIVLFILFGVINSCYAASWDLLMDWDHVYVYYVAMVADVCLRFTWVWYLFGGGPSVPVKGFISALLEVARRIIWNGFRVESEHIGNADGYRVTRDVPLPYVMPGASLHDLKDDGEPDTRSRKERFFDFIHTLHASVVKDFAPLVNLQVLRPRPHPHRTHSNTKKISKVATNDSSSAASDDGEGDEGSSASDADDDLRTALGEAEEIQRAGQQSVDAELEGHEETLDRDR